VGRPLFVGGPVNLPFNGSAGARLGLQKRGGGGVGGTGFGFFLLHSWDPGKGGAFLVFTKRRQGVFCGRAAFSAFKFQGDLSNTLDGGSQLFH